MAPENCIKVKRDGPRGWHWVSKDTFDPSVHELADAPLVSKARGKRGASHEG